MNVSKISKLFFVIALLITIPYTALAATKTSVIKAVEKKQTATVLASRAASTPVAEINLRNAQIISQKDNTFKLAFDIVNKEGLQTNVKYGIQLIPEKAQYIYDQKAYEETLTIYPNTTTKKEIEYTAPISADGVYILQVLTNNESGFPFGIASFGKVTLVGTKKFLSIDSSSCYLQIDSDKTAKHYTLNQGLFIEPNQSPLLTCTVTNQSSESIAANASFVVRYFSIYGNVIGKAGKPTDVVTLLPGEKKAVTFSMGQFATPQFYYVTFSLGNKNNTSNEVYVHYVVNGISATIQKVSLDKDLYKKDEKGVLSLIWSSTSGNLGESGKVAVPLPKLTMKVTIQDPSGINCIDPIEKPLVRDFSKSQYETMFTVKRVCSDPKASIRILDDKGTVLDQKDFIFKTGADATRQSAILVYLLGIGFILILFGAALYKKLKDNYEGAL